jgi:hypothetical protein
MSRYVVSNLLGLVGAAIGGVLGFYVYRWVLNQGFIGGMIPGAFLGLGCSLLARHPSMARGVVCGVAGLILGFFTDWYTTITKQTFWEYLRDVKSINQVILLTIAIGTFIAFWLGKDAGIAGRSGLATAPAEKTAPQQEGQAG